ncbi:MAG: FAD-dependent oxidoreductase [Candidatus Aminicenantes bacterium]|nr:FAD-dependent oxidoreductase [Candidatus Aminicenantes bacterium]
MNKNIGVYVCECGPNIPERIDVDKVVQEMSSMDEVKTVKKFNLMCSNDGKKFLKEEIEKQKLSHVVVAACSPKDHEKTFMSVCQESGLNPYLFQLVNIREQCAWMIPDKEEATSKAVKYIRAGIHRVLYHNPLKKKEIEINTDVLVIGGGLSGIEAALSLAGPKRKVHIIEKTDSLGGMAADLSQVLPHQGSKMDLIKKKVEQLESSEFVNINTFSQVKEVRGFLGNFEAVINTHSGNGGVEEKEIKIGAVIVATGFNLFDLKKNPIYGYGEADNVLNATEFEDMINSEKILLKSGKKPKSVALVHCAGRKEQGYCSKVCCLYNLKFAHYLRDHHPDIEVKELVIDWCLPHKQDQSYFEEAKDKGVDFIRMDELLKTKSTGDQIQIEFKTNDKSHSVSVDMAVVAPAMVPSEDTTKLADILNIPLDKSGFFKELHEMLDPVSTPMEGIYLTGCALGPKNIHESLTQSHATSGKIFSTLVPGRKIEPEVKVSEIKEDLCTGCQTCLSVCFYGAITTDSFKGVSVVNEAICRGCGNCVGSCPSGAIRSKHFTYPQLYQEVLDALR